MYKGWAISFLMAAMILMPQITRAQDYPAFVTFKVIVIDGKLKQDGGGEAQLPEVRVLVYGQAPSRLPFGATDDTAPTQFKLRQDNTATVPIIVAKDGYQTQSKTFDTKVSRTLTFELFPNGWTGTVPPVDDTGDDTPPGGTGGGVAGDAEYADCKAFIGFNAFKGNVLGVDVNGFQFNIPLYIACQLNNSIAAMGQLLNEILKQGSSIVPL